MPQDSFFSPPEDFLARSTEAESSHQEIPPVEEKNWQVEIIQRCLAGDEAAFALIVEYYGNLLLRTAYLLVKDEELAKDVVQEALLQAWKNLRQLREPTFLRAWLLKIVVNQATSFKRQLIRKATLLREQFTQYALDLSIHQSDAERGSLEEHVDIAQALSLLPDNQRIVLVLFYYQHMPMPEIASCLGVAENTLRKRLQAALEKMRRVLYIDSADEKQRSLPASDTLISLRKEGVS